MIIAIDFDGTIVEHDFPRIGKLKPNAKTVINRLYDHGHHIIIWTCRTSQNSFTPEDAPTVFHCKDFLDREGIRYHTINHNHPDCSFQPSPKVYAHVYIDDKQLGGIPVDWEEIFNILLLHHDLVPQKATETNGAIAATVESKKVDTPICDECKGRTALVSGSFSFDPDEEPYCNGVTEEAKVASGQCFITVYKCDSCTHVQGFNLE